MLEANHFIYSLILCDYCYTIQLLHVIGEKKGCFVLKFFEKCCVWGHDINSSSLPNYTYQLEVKDTYCSFVVFWDLFSK